MSIYPTREGWNVDYRDEFGRRHRRYAGRDETAARTLDQALSEKHKRSRQTMSAIAGAPIQLSAARELWLQSLTANEATKQQNRRRIDNLIRHIGDQETQQITPQAIQSWQAQRRKQVAPPTLYHDIRTARALFNWLTANWLTAADPTAGIKIKYTHSHTGRCITYEEEKQTLESNRTLNTEVKVLLAIDAGLRISEAINLTRGAWNREARTITVYSTKTRTARTIPTTRRLEAALERAAANKAPYDRITSGNPHHASQGAFMRGINRPSLRYHELRHTFASRLAAVANPNCVRELLGHAPHTVTEIYLHTSPAEAREAIDAMERANPNTHSTPLRSAQQEQQQANPTPERKETTTMPGKRYSFRLEGTRYGPLDRQRVRVADNQTSNQPGQVTVEAAELEGKFVVSLQDLHPIEQPTTLPKEEAE